MTRPSGVCEGQPCYTDFDRAEIDAELLVAMAVLAVAQAEVIALQNEKITAYNNQCPCSQSSSSSSSSP